MGETVLIYKSPTISYYWESLDSPCIQSVKSLPEHETVSETDHTHLRCAHHLHIDYYHLGYSFKMNMHGVNKILIS